MNADRGVSIYVLGDKQPLAVLRNVGNPTFGEMQTMKGFPMEQTVHLMQACRSSCQRRATASSSFPSI
jgi:hypothetical protein